MSFKNCSIPLDSNSSMPLMLVGFPISSKRSAGSALQLNRLGKKPQSKAALQALRLIYFNYRSR
jgi:hypothetical protein